MLRGLLLLLLGANLVYWAWWQGWLPGDLLPLPRGGAGQREPGRLASQVLPELIEVVDARQAERLSTLRCLQAGPFDDIVWPAVEAAAARAGLGAGTYQRLPADAPATGSVLRVPEADEALQARLQSANEAAFGGPFRPCP